MPNKYRTHEVLFIFKMKNYTIMKMYDLHLHTTTYEFHKHNADHMSQTQKRIYTVWFHLHEVQ